MVNLYLFILLNKPKKLVLENVVLSSDSDEILTLANNTGVDLTIKRPKSLARDSSPKLPAIQHCLLTAEKNLIKNLML